MIYTHKCSVDIHNYLLCFQTYNCNNVVVGRKAVPLCIVVWVCKLQSKRADDIVSERKYRIVKPTLKSQHLPVDDYRPPVFSHMHGIVNTTSTLYSGTPGCYYSELPSYFTGVIDKPSLLSSHERGYYY